MTHDCPDCGTALDLSERTVRIRVGACPQCHHTFSLLPHDAPSETGGPAAVPDAGIDALAGTELPETPAGSGEGETRPPRAAKGAKAAGDDDGETPVCGTCGSDLVFRAADEVTIEVYCPQCEETTRFRAESAEPPAPTREPRERFERRGARPERGGRDRDDGDRPPPRGCRRCGGPIDFETTPDGGRVGVCRNCGNRFTLPPRRDDDSSGGYRGRSSYRERSGPPRRSYGGERSGPPRERRTRRPRDADGGGWDRRR